LVDIHGRSKVQLTLRIRWHI